MKKVIAIVLAVAILVTCLAVFAGCKKDNKETLQVYTNAGFAPFEYVNEKGEVVGVDIDIMNYIGNELGYKVVINDIDFDSIPNEVKGNKLAVGAAGMSKTDARDEIMLASNVYATSVQYVIAPNGTFGASEKVTLAQILAAASNIGVQAGTTGEGLINDEIEATEATNQVIQYKNAITASGDIGSSIQAVIIDELPAKSIADANSGLSCWKIDAEPESYVLYFNKEATELVKKVNEVLDKMIKDGTINQYIINHSSGK